ncbi:hypothetical protein MAPG_11289 [Magnaporthiopsis poae ATCC 64411]|uniref:Uncharacterized protein n=1 Tax=Magnaporthiopsis poae (strain ATCC 64411 / 73-15) TaxID=644358 RepID=A0A0C4EEV7_MAGP6|nr:hypothetical protein MAPG_11289 [Magnaporthiopsis poae ATCC 64411]
MDDAALELLDPAADADADADVEPVRRSRPPTAAIAAGYLLRLCHALGLGDRQLGLIHATLTIELPPPRLVVRLDSVPAAWPTGTPTDFPLIGRYMSLSLSDCLFGAALWGPFGNPSVPCNHAGAWLGPITAAVKPMVQRGRIELLIKTMAIICPKTVPLWLGAAPCRHQSRLKHLPRTLTKPYCFLDWSRPDVDSAARTGVSQSFMDEHPPGPRLRKDGTVARADVWRLRHACRDKYDLGHGPMLLNPEVGRPPFGHMRVEDVELEIRGHLFCSHAWVYAFWTWLPSGQRDDGFTELSLFPVEPQSRTGAEPENLRCGTIKDYIIGCKILIDVSEVATRTIFDWCREQTEKGLASVVRQTKPGYPMQQAPKRSGEGVNPFAPRRSGGGCEPWATDAGRPTQTAGRTSGETTQRFFP